MRVSVQVPVYMCVCYKVHLHIYVINIPGGAAHESLQQESNIDDRIQANRRRVKVRIDVCVNVGLCVCIRLYANDTGNSNAGNKRQSR